MGKATTASSVKSTAPSSTAATRSKRDSTLILVSVIGIVVAGCLGYILNSSNKSQQKEVTRLSQEITELRGEVLRLKHEIEESETKCQRKISSILRNVNNYKSEKSNVESNLKQVGDDIEQLLESVSDLGEEPSSTKQISLDDDLFMQ
eukprot:TRINITY_DN12310_c0_g1_i3.p1 TRINITY_DN12310_c0_g1~~TRINITY_DN12310_c0_g1_i3.p1  ORF type:complete len:148 (+),score=27.48 TRINITY_DN12310_c0_g1_i3:55-498(+)